jgi:predicted MFS family arabinose efflux permease
MACNIALWMAGIALTLAGPLWAIILGLMLCASCGLLCQAISTGYVTVTAQAGRSSAVGLYVTSFYLGGAVGATLGGFAWTFGGWSACVASTAVMLTIMGFIVLTFWERAPRDKPPAPVASV